MPIFTTAQATAVMAIQQLVNDWAFDLDSADGMGLGPLLAQDCRYGVGENVVVGRDEVLAHYQRRLDRLKGTPGGPPLQRHIISNLRVRFGDERNASITFALIYFSTAATGGVARADPAAVADVRMECRCEDEDAWRIAAFASNQPFQRQ